MVLRKPWLSNKQFRIIQDELDRAGYITRIEHDGVQYNYYLGFEIMSQHKTRETIRKKIVLLFNRKFPKKAIKFRKYE